MGPLDMTLHVLAFAAPALFTGAAVALFGRYVLRTGALRWLPQAAINAGAGLAVSVAGLWWFGVDGKMATYAALVAAVASTQWLFGRSWRG